MPGPRRGRGERRLESALEALAGALNETRAPWMVIGGVAVIARGVKRMTTDLDVVVRGDGRSTGVTIIRLATASVTMVSSASMEARSGGGKVYDSAGKRKSRCWPCATSSTSPRNSP